MTLRQVSFVVPLVLSFLAGCKDPAKDAPKAEVRAPSDVAAEAPTPGHQALAISEEASKVGFVGSKVTGSHDGGFKKFSGTIHLDPKGPEASRVEVDIDMTSIWSDTERLTGHLKTGDFFLVEQHPKGRFVSTEVVPSQAEGATHNITGNLTLRGVTKTISFPAKIEIAEDAVRARAEFALPRKQFGIAWEGQPDNLVRDEVLIKLDVVAPRAAK